MSNAEDHEGTRRDFLYYATAGAGAVAAGAAVWPLVNQMNPSADVQAMSSIRVDTSGVEIGTQLTVKWLGKPVFIRRRTAEEIEAARAVTMDELHNRPDISEQKQLRCRRKRRKPRALRRWRMAGDDRRLYTPRLRSHRRWRG